MYCVSRQAQWAENGRYVVEISKGGIDYMNADALVGEYKGECEEFKDPREAVETAIRIAKQWQEDEKKSKEPSPVFIGIGYTHGMCMPFEAEELTEDTFKALKEQAAKEYEAVRKCDMCGEPIWDEKHAYKLIDSPFDELFCREYCAEKAYLDSLEDTEEGDE